MPTPYADMQFAQGSTTRCDPFATHLRPCNQDMARPNHQMFENTITDPNAGLDKHRANSRKMHHANMCNATALFDEECHCTFRNAHE